LSTLTGAFLLNIPLLSPPSQWTSSNLHSSLKKGIGKLSRHILPYPLSTQFPPLLTNLILEDPIFALGAKCQVTQRGQMFFKQVQARK
jgi:hypothetical protein